VRKKIIENQNESPVTGMMQNDSPPTSSVDSEIDALIVKYEKEAADAGEAAEEGEKLLESLQKLNLNFLLEQDEEGAAPEEQEKEQPKKPAEEEKPKIDINTFTSKVARLVMNAHAILPVEEVIIARAVEFLKKNYDQSYADQMQDILDNQYDFDLTGEEDIIDVPIAAGAGVKASGG